MANFAAILGPARIRRRGGKGGNPARRLQIVHYGDSPTSPRKYARYFHGLMERTWRARARVRTRKRDSSVVEHGDVQVPRAQARLSLMVIYDESRGREREREREREKERKRERERERERESALLSNNIQLFCCCAYATEVCTACGNASGNFQIIAPRFSSAISRLIPHIDKAR